MSTWHIGLSVPLRQIFVALDESAIPATHPKFGTFIHNDDDQDILDVHNSHAIYQHVQDMVYHRSDTQQNVAKFFPDGITDLQKYEIISPAFRKVTGIDVTGDAAINTTVNTDLEFDIAIAPAEAYNQAVTVTTSNAKVATAWQKVTSGEGKSKLVIRTHDKGEASVTVTTMDGYFSKTKKVTVY